MKTENQPPTDFGRHGEFLEKSVRHILKHNPESIAFVGVLKDGSYIGAYNNASMNDKCLMAGNILIDVIMDIIRHNAPEIRDILESAEEIPEEADPP